jgi:CHASE2 domain-containing sensor protein
VVFSARLDLLRHLDNQQYDLFHRLAGERYPATHTLLIGVDHQNIPGEDDLRLYCSGGHAMRR